MKGFVLLLLSIFIFNIVYSDDGYFQEFPQSGTIYPLTNNNIKMISEIVIYSNNSFTTVFYFSNTSSIAQNVKIGFPVVGNFDYTLEPDKYAKLNEQEKENNIITYYKFNSYVNNRETKRNLKKIDPNLKITNYDYAYVSDVLFSPKEMITISNTYNQVGSESGNNMGEKYYTINYILKTGALWKDSIGYVDVYFYLDRKKFKKYLFSPPKGTLGFYCKTSLLSQKTDLNSNLIIMEWHYTNLKPEEDIFVTWGVEGTNKLKINEFANDFYNNRFETYSKNDLVNTFLTDKDLYKDFLKACVRWNNFYGATDLPTIQFMINSVFAMYGYKFDNKKLGDMFTKFSWYQPLIKEPVLSNDDKLLMDKMKEMRSNFH